MSAPMHRHPLADPGKRGVLTGTSLIRLEEIRKRPVQAAIFGLAVGGLWGAGVASYGPLIPSVLLLMALFSLVAFRQPEVGLLGIVGVMTLLPFAVVPVRLGLSPTFMDFTLTVLMIAWLSRAVRSRRLETGGILGVLVLVYLGLTLVAFLHGLTFSISPERMRLFVKGVNSTLFFFTVVNCVPDAAALRRVIGSLQIGGAIAACIALGILALSDQETIAALSALSPLGYPSGPGVLRTIAETETVRATGTSIDPNVLGGLLMTVGALLAAQIVTSRPVFSRRLMLLIAVPVLTALLSTYSRTAWGGLAIAIMIIATARARRLWLLIPAGVLLMLILPQGQVFVERFLSGLAFQDRAAVMRLAEYRDAINLIGMYPWFGIGFGETPAIGLYIGVSSMYLLLGQEMGLIGLASFVAVLAAAILRVVDGYTRAGEESRGLLLTTGAVLAAVAAAGLFDHYFSNIQFPHMVALFWLYVGLSAAAVRLAGGERT